MKFSFAFFITLYCAIVSAEQLFAEVDKSGIVVRVIVADPVFISKQPGTWVETFKDSALRKRYAGIGDSYDKALNDFTQIKTISPSTAPSFPLITGKGVVTDGTGSSTKW